MTVGADSSDRFAADSFGPLAVARRSGLDESVHAGAGVVVNPSGTVVASVGDPELTVYLRSSLKAFQATAMVERGLELPTQLLALVTSSHSGEERHRAGVLTILDRYGLGVEALQNASTLPYGEAPRNEVLRAGEGPSSLFQNCSGKHAGMLATCVINGWDTASYLDPGHPLQEAISSWIDGQGARVHHVGVDGCGAPTHALGLRESAALLGSMAVSASPVLASMRGFPEMVGGDGRDVTEWMRAVPGLVAKDGAAGVQALVLTDGDRCGWASVYKVADGSSEARRAVIPAALAAMGVDVEAASAQLGDRAIVPVLGGGAPVGVIDPVAWS